MSKCPYSSVVGVWVITVTAYVDAKAAYGVDRTGLSCADQQ